MSKVSNDIIFAALTGQSHHMVAWKCLFFSSVKLLFTTILMMKAWAGLTILQKFRLQAVRKNKKVVLTSEWKIF